ncbi:hypothetical protein CYMTET_37269 [Cymbomonas tetramitiformis]|uniref:SAM-dependent MTase RsmB/NOP-type domain-containing protein n=1 Tax=Cymbomonas tetramitiformis TaxID=36881 RepID=A0AAE0CGM6_9CHLO|nr:hypothetical protein CYMTET_37269 [Cymbomonas tetramitiformis]|eukprot:gene9087-10765_t
MDFETLTGLCAVVTEEASGQRLQRYVAQAFRTDLGRSSSNQYSGANRKHDAHAACQDGKVWVNGKPEPGNHVVSSGDVVTLLNSIPPKGSSTTRHDEAPGTVRTSSIEGAGESQGRMVYSMSPVRDLPACDSSLLHDPFAEYYRQQAICSEADWKRSLHLFSRPMGLSVRLSQTPTKCASAASTLRGLFGNSISQLRWLSSAWHVVSSSEGAASDAASINRFLLQAQATGELCQQEKNSMLPPLALAPLQPHHNVLDLCCAPGSKTLQLLDMLRDSSTREASESAGQSAIRQTGNLSPVVGGGMLLANDFELPRCERTRLRAQCFDADCIPLVITCADARTFPELRAHQREDGSGADHEIKFHRILADVPCGGDGTLRKSPEKRAKWSPRTAMQNHPIQVAILRRALELLAPGGRLVYSTCSLNPLEDEAVVYAALRDAPEGLHTVLPPAEVFASHAEMGWCPGLASWRVPHPEFQHNQNLYQRLEDVPGEIRNGSLIRESMFPPTADVALEGGIRLENCMRLLPIHDDGGGFFLAVIGKSPSIDEVPTLGGRATAPHTGTLNAKGDILAGMHTVVAAEDVPALYASPTVTDETPYLGASDPRKTSRGPSDCLAVEPSQPSPESWYRPISAHAFGKRHALPNLQSFFGLPLTCADAAAQQVSQFPVDQLIVREDDEQANLLFISPSIVHQLERCDGLQVVAAGMPTFHRMSACAWWPPLQPWRVCQAAAALLSACCTRRVLRMLPERFAQLLRARAMPLHWLGELDAEGALYGLESCMLTEDGEEIEPGAVLISSSQDLERHLLTVSAVISAETVMILAHRDVVERCLDILGAQGSTC